MRAVISKLYTTDSLGFHPNQLKRSSRWRLIHKRLDTRLCTSIARNLCIFDTEHFSLRVNV